MRSAMLAAGLCDRGLSAGGFAGALQAAIHRGDAAVENLGHLGGGELEHLAQDQDRALDGRQVLQRRHEGQLDALPLGIPGLRIAAGTGGRAGLGFWVRLEPDWLGDQVTEVVDVGPGRAVAGTEEPASPGRRQPQAGVGGDPVQPRPQRGAALEAGQPAPGG